MSNADVRDEFVALQARLDRGELTIEEIGGAFERLAWSLVEVSKQDDAVLRGWINDIEHIRFSERVENQALRLTSFTRHGSSSTDSRDCCFRV